MDIYTIRAINNAQKEIKQAVAGKIESTIRHGKVIISNMDTHEVYLSCLADKEVIEDKLLQFIINTL